MSNTFQPPEILKRIVFVEDETGLFDFLKEYYLAKNQTEVVATNSLSYCSLRLLDRKWLVHFCDRSENALKIIILNYLRNDPIDLLVCDLIMPGVKNGFWLLASINALKININKIIVTAYKNDRNLQRSLMYGVTKFIGKSDLAIADILGGQADLDQQILDYLESQDNLIRDIGFRSEELNEEIYLRWTLNQNIETLSLGSLNPAEIEKLKNLEQM